MRSNRIPPLVAASLGVLLVSPLSANDALPGSQPLTAPLGLDPQNHLEVRYQSEPVLTTVLDATEVEDGVYAVVSSLLGSGTATDVSGDLSSFHFSFNGGAQFDLAVGPAGNVAYSGSVGLADLRLFPRAAQCWPLPGYGNALVDFIKLKSKKGAVAIQVKRKDATNINTVSFVQFANLTICFGGVDSDGNPFSGTMPKNPKVGTTGNGGQSGNDLTTGQGYTHPDGSTVNVDAGFVRTGRPAGYVEAGPRGAGDLSATNPYMVDIPGGNGQSSANAVATGQSTPSRPVSWVTFKFRFTTYVLINKKVVKRIKWHWSAKYTIPGNNDPEYAGDVDSADDVTGYDTDDQAALDNWNAGHYDGAPFVQ